MDDRFNYSRILRISLCLAALLALTFTFQKAVAQDVPEALDLFRGADEVSRQALGGTALKRLEVLEQNSTTKSVRLVRIADDLSQQRALTMHVAENTKAPVPRLSPVFHRDSDKQQNAASGRAVELLIRRDKVNALSDEAYAWTGTVKAGAGSWESAGDVTLVQDADGAVTGTIRIESEIYTVRPLAGGLHALVDTDESKYTPGGDGPLYSGGASGDSRTVPSPETTSPQPPAASSEPAVCTASAASLSFGMLDQRKPSALPAAAAAPCPQYDVSVLVVYTSRAAQGRNVNGIINLAIQESNESYSNSNAGSIDLDLAHRQQVTFSESNNLREDVDRLQMDGTIQSLRDQHDADVVVLLGEYSEGSRAAELRAEAEDAYAIVNVDDATGGVYAFPHEIGHLQGAQHHPNNACPLGDPECDEEGDLFPNAFGHRFRSGFRFATMMAYNTFPHVSKTHLRIKHFSDPNVSFRGEATGTSSRNNADALRATESTVEDFRGTTTLDGRLRVVSGDPYDPKESNYTFESDACGGSGSYSYEWRISYHGQGNYGNVLGTQRTFSKSFPPGTHFVKVTTTGGGQQDEAVRSIEFDPYPSAPTMASSEGEAAQEGLSSAQNAAHAGLPTRFALRLAGPNPFRAATTISYDLPKSADVNLVVYDMMGREVKRLSGGSHAAGTHQKRIDGSAFASGVYMVRLTAGTQTKTQRITVVK